MTVQREQHTNNVLIGAGEVYIKLDGEAAERYLGDAVSASLGLTTEEATVFSGSGPVAQELERVTRTVTRQFTVTLHDMSPENLALFTGPTSSASRTPTRLAGPGSRRSR